MKNQKKKPRADLALEKVPQLKKIKKVKDDTAQNQAKPQDKSLPVEELKPEAVASGETSGKPEELIPEKKAEVVIDEEKIRNLPVIQELKSGLEQINSSLQLIASATDQKTQVFAEDINRKIHGLAEAINVLADGFAKGYTPAGKPMVKTADHKTAASTELGHIPVGATEKTEALSTKSEILERIPVEPNKQEQLWSWVELIMQLITKGGGGAVNTQAAPGNSPGVVEMFKMMLDINEKAEERSLKRTSDAIALVARMASAITGKGITVPEVITGTPGKHLE